MVGANHLPRWSRPVGAGRGGVLPGCVPERRFSTETGLLGAPGSPQPAMVSGGGIRVGRERISLAVKPARRSRGGPDQRRARCTCVEPGGSYNFRLQCADNALGCPARSPRGGRRSGPCGCSSVGRAPRCQRGCRGFESHHPLCGRSSPPSEPGVFGAAEGRGCRWPGGRAVARGASLAGSAQAFGPAFAEVVFSLVDHRAAGPGASPLPCDARGTVDSRGPHQARDRLI